VVNSDIFSTFIAAVNYILKTEKVKKFCAPYKDDQKVSGRCPENNYPLQFMFHE